MVMVVPDEKLTGDADAGSVVRATIVPCAISKGGRSTTLLSGTGIAPPKRATDADDVTRALPERVADVSPETDALNVADGVGFEAPDPSHPEAANRTTVTNHPNATYEAGVFSRCMATGLRWK
jgi:hypothetical protein